MIIFSKNKSNRSRSITNGGFTLVESAISLFIFACVVVIFAGSVILAEKSSHMNGEYAQALSLAQHKIEQLRAIGFGRLDYEGLDDPGSIIDHSPASSPYSFKEVDNVEDYLPNSTAKLYISYDSGTIARATVIITWNKSSKGQSKPSEVKLVALIPNVE